MAIYRHKLIRKQKVSGQSLFEVLFAIAIAAVVMVSVVSLASNSLRNTLSTRDNTLANRYAQELAEWLRAYRDANDWEDDFIPQSSLGGSVWCAPSLPTNTSTWDLDSGACPANATISGTIFLRQVTLTKSSDDSTVTAAILVTWTDSQGSHQVQTVTRFTNWQTL